MNKNAWVAFLVALAFIMWGAIWLVQQSSNRPSYNILFLADDTQNIVQIFEVQEGSTAVSPVTDMEVSVTGYAISPDKTKVAFTTSEMDLGLETIWLMNSNGRSLQPLLTCESAACHNLVWAPDGQRLIYERRELDAAGIPGWPRLWWLDTINQASEPVLSGDSYSASASLSPDGHWIAYYSPPDEGLWLYNFADGRSQFLASEPGAPAVWHPDGQSLLYTAFNTVEWEVEEDEHSADTHSHTNLTTHLFLYDLATGQSQQVSPEVVIEDSVPAWSPDGAWIAFGRRQVRTAASRQVWLMRADGSDVAPLTDDPELNAGPPQWSPDGRFLLFQRIDLEIADGDPGIWLFEMASGELYEIAHPGYLPKFK